MFEGALSRAEERAKSNSNDRTEDSNKSDTESTLNLDAASLRQLAGTKEGCVRDVCMYDG